MNILLEIDLMLESQQKSVEQLKKRRTYAAIGGSIAGGAGAGIAMGMQRSHAIKGQVPEYLKPRALDGKVTATDYIGSKVYKGLSNKFGANLGTQLGGEITGGLASTAVTGAAGSLAKGLVNKYYQIRHGIQPEKVSAAQRLKNIGKMAKNTTVSTARSSLIKAGVGKAALAAGVAVNPLAMTAAVVGGGMAHMYLANKMKQKFSKPKNTVLPSTPSADIAKPKTPNILPKHQPGQPNIPKTQKSVAPTTNFKSTSQLQHGLISKCPPGTRRNSMGQCINII